MADANVRSGGSLRVAIVGGGFAGLCLAIGLLRNGISVQIYEAGAAFSEIGAGITLSPNGVRAMHLLDPRIEDSFLKNATSNGVGSDRDIFWECRNGQSDKADLLYAVEGPAYKSIHRATFLRLLSELLPKDVITFGKILVKLSQDDSGVKLSFADGSTADADAVVGADGVRSCVRECLRPEAKVEPSYHGIYTYRGLVSMDKAVSLLGHDLAMTAQNYVGDGAHVITYPIENGTLLNVAACKRDTSQTWPHSRWQVASSEDRMLADFQGFGEPVHDILSLIKSTDQWAGFDIPTPLSSFVNDRILLIGDAAHATTPHQGAGVSQAIEDSYILSNLLNESIKTANMPLAFQAFDKIRRPRTEKIISTSRDAATIYHLRTVNLNGVPKALAGRYDWIWYIDLEAHLKEAQEYYESIAK